MSNWKAIFGKPIGPSVFVQQREKENAAQREIFDAKLKEIFAASLPNTDAADFLRAFVESDDWFVAVTADGAFDAMEVKAGKYRLALDPAPDSHDKKHRGGHGGRLLPIYSEQPDRPTTPLDGRALTRALPEDIDGLLLFQPEPSPRELGREHFAALRDLAVAYDFEAMLVAPAQNQVELLKRANWLVEMAGRQLHLDNLLDRGRLVQAYTHADRMGANAQPVVAMPGEQLFALVAENHEADGLAVNPCRTLGYGETKLYNFVLSPGFACRLLEGEDIRPGARPLPARNVQEVELWLNLHGFPWEGRQLIDAPYPERTLIRAMVPQGSYWRMQETLTPQEPAPGPTWSPVFTIPPGGIDNGINNSDSDHPLEVSTGPSRILCAGLLAQALNAGASRGKDAATYWQVGRWMGLGRVVSDAEQQLSWHRLTLATELAKLLPAGVDQIPRSALLTVEGAAFLAEHPHGGSRAWIEATVRQARRYTQRWVWRS